MPVAERSPAGDGARGARPGKAWWARWSLWLPAFALACGVALQFRGFDRAPSHRQGPALASVVPRTITGWSGRDLPLGPNEFVATAAEKVLNFDDYVNREFTRGGQSFSVYVAYWGAGKMPTRLVASHTPDRCWTENGWRCREMRFRQPESVGGTPLQPAEWRLFDPPQGGPPVYVLYWHLVDGRAYDYGDRFNAIPDPYRWWKDVVQQVVLGNREQYFIRLTSTQPLDNLWTDPGFLDVVRSLGRLGLVSKPPAAPPS